MKISLSDLEFDLPESLIANVPLADRSASRLLYVRTNRHSFEDRKFTDVVNILRPGDVLVLNNTQVFPARLCGRSDTGAEIELFLVREIEGRQWVALAKPARRLRPGKRVIVGEDCSVEIVERTSSGRFIIRFEGTDEIGPLIDRYGKTPLPPYIVRTRANEAKVEDRERYQTIYARERGAIAAPTAGLHFTQPILAGLVANGVQIVEITLHVGYGTFEPVRTDDLLAHKVESEDYSISENTAETINLALQEGRRIVAVGTTTTRALESNFQDNGRILAGNARAELTIVPGYKFNVISSMLTNFHLPKSSLLVLVSTFAGHELIMEAYDHAIKERYRFYSYGDCMLIEN